MSDEKLPDEEYLKLVRNAKSELDVLRKYPTRRPAEQKDQEPFSSNTTIAESKTAPDMQILEEPAAGGSDAEATHPFKVSPNGDDTVTVAAGEIIEFAPQTSGSTLNIPFKGVTTSYDGTDSFSVSASGFLYLVLNVVDSVWADDSTFGVSTIGFSVDSLFLSMGQSLVGDQISFPIAQLTLTDGVVSVAKQILTYNPTLQLSYQFVYVP